MEKNITIIQRGEKLIRDYKFFNDSIYEKMFLLEIYASLMGVILCFLLYIIIGPLGLPALINTINAHYSNIYSTLTILSPVLIILFTIVLLNILIISIKRLTDINTSTIRESILCIQKDIYSQQTIDEIISKIKIGQKSLSKNYIIEILKMINNELKTIHDTVLLDHRGWLINITRNLQSDLATRFAEQQSTLTEAKSDLEANVKGTSELNSISELQQERLERQIEQFEELQRVLVKI